MTLHGVRAVNRVTELEGPLNSIEKRIVEVEGFKASEYDDDKGIKTSGVGQTGAYRDKTFKETVADFMKKAKSTFPKFNNYPEELQAELVQLYYRGDVNKNFSWVKSLNKGDYKAAGKELLNHKEYISRKKKGDDGVTKRLEEASKIISNYS
jgi:GH24 family phage-related lysozyme (muramidase)